MRIACVSDTHNKLSRVRVPDADLLVHAGDLTMGGTWREAERELRVLQALPHPRKVLIAGNHDWIAQQEPREFAEACRAAGIEYLCDEATEVDGYVVYGSPWQPRFYDWAFNLDRGSSLRERWDRIPADTDVLVTHGPPAGVMDLVPRGERVGCADLRAALARVKPKLHVFGHIHCGAGTATVDGVLCVNASALGENYEVERGAFVVEIP